MSIFKILTFDQIYGVLSVWNDGMAGNDEIDGMRVGILTELTRAGYLCNDGDLANNRYGIQITDAGRMLLAQMRAFAPMPHVKIVNKSDNPLPQYKTAGSAGADVYANIPEYKDIKLGMEIYPNSPIIVPTGLFMEIPMGYELQLRTRSSMAYKKGLIVANSPATIDSDYRGEIGVILLNTRKHSVSIQHGDRIAQMVFARVESARFKSVGDVSELSDTKRGDGGFGSTGKN